MKDNKQEILRYIQNEKDLAQYHISRLEKDKNFSPAKRRILDIERDFISLPLESLPFEDVADIAAAISIFRTSRSLFYQTYQIAEPIINKGKYLDLLIKKFNFIKKIGIDYLNTKPQELNLVQSSEFNYDLAKRQSLKNGSSIEIEKRQIDILSLGDLLKIEPLTIAKKRARAQAVMFSIGKYLLESLKNIEISEQFSKEELEQVEAKLNEIIKNLRFNIFKYYNDGLNSLPNQLKGTMGENNYLSKIHPLQNVLDFSNLKKIGMLPRPVFSSESFSGQAPMFGNLLSKKVIFSSSTRDAEIKKKNKVFGILLPIPRKGNEKMTLLYKNIRIWDIDTSHLFSDNFSNVKALRGSKENYFKAILLEPFWKIIKNADQDPISKFLIINILKLKQDQFVINNFDDKEYVEKLNSSQFEFFPISKGSVALAAKTRSEEEGLMEIFPIINSKISEINDEYFRLDFSTSNSY